MPLVLLLACADDLTSNPAMLTGTDESTTDLVVDEHPIDDAGAPSQYPLSRIPLVDTLTVDVRDPDGATFRFFEWSEEFSYGDWSYFESANAVAFLEFVPSPGATVLLTYEPGD